MGCKTVIKDNQFQVYSNYNIADLDRRRWTIYISGDVLWQKAGEDWVKSIRRDAKNCAQYFVLAYFDEFSNRVYVKPYTTR